MGKIDSKSVVPVDVGHLDPSKVAADRKAEESHLKRRKNELKQEQAGISIDPYKILPCESEDVVRMRDVAVWIR